MFDDGTEATFAENIATAASLAAGLAERYGIGHGDRVAILAANTPEWIQSFWAITSLGAIAVAMNGWWTEDEIRYGLELTTPKLLLADAKRAERIKGDPGVPLVVFEKDFAELRDHAPGADLPDTPIDEDDAATILFTSGTTGRPKGAIITHRNFNAYLTCAFILGARDAFRFPANPDDPPKPPMLSLAASPLFTSPGSIHAASPPWPRAWAMCGPRAGSIRRRSCNSPRRTRSPVSAVSPPRSGGSSNTRSSTSTTPRA